MIAEFPWEGIPVGAQEGLSTAESVRRALSASDIRACTLEGGYAVKDDGKRILFESARELECKRNANGRCTKLVVEFKDGSRLQFTWSETAGPRYTLAK